MSSTSPAVGRALDLLLYLAGKSGPVTGAAIARDLRIPRSSTYHLLDVLVARGFVVHFPDRRTYGLGMAAFEVGSAYLRHDPLEMLARPVLARLVAQVGETAHLGVLHGAETLYLLKEQPAVTRIPVTLVTDVGVRLPAQLTASGRSILAHLPAAQVREQALDALGQFDLATQDGRDALEAWIRQMVASPEALEALAKASGMTDRKSVV